MYETLEAAQARILELETEKAALEADKKTLSENNEKLTRDAEELRTINQNYYNRLIQQFTPEKPDEDKEQDAPSCEDFAKTLNIL